MAAPGRPIERPAHLSDEQRTRAQEWTKQLRMNCGLSQREMAAAVHVSTALYRTWESGKEGNPGPTRQQAEWLDRALREQLHDGYTEGEAFDIWGWPRQQDMSYDGVLDLLRLAGFELPRLNPNGHTPASVFWVHRVREPNLVHGVFSLAAAAATRAGIKVHLLLDDLERSNRQNDELCEELNSRIRTWFAFASGDGDKLSTRRYSEVLTEQHLAERGWPAIKAYLNPDIGVLDFLVASKAIAPLLYTTKPEESVLDLLRNAESLGAEKLLTPLHNWMVFEQQIGWILDRSADAGAFVITLGGEDERALWEAFHQGCSADLSARVRHLYLQSFPMPSYRSPWKERALWAGVGRATLNNYLLNRMPADDGDDLLDWLLRAAIRLPGSLNPGFHDGLDPALQEVEALLRRTAHGLPPATVGSIAKAVVEWLDL
jgi:transcriptional regulator with XRE-family HTH domain